MILFAALVVWFIGWYLTSYATYNLLNNSLDPAIAIVSILVWPIMLIIAFFQSSYSKNIFSPLEISFEYLNKLFKIKS